MGRSLVLLVLLASANAQDFGIFKVDITPTHPIRLAGYGSRRVEATEAAQRLWARAISIGSEEARDAVLLITVDLCGITQQISDEVAARIEKRSGIPREQVVFCASHTHSGPMISGGLKTLFGVPVPDDHQERIDRYTRVLVDRLEEVGTSALRNPRPGRIHYGRGSVGFAANRRTAGGPTDHDVPVLTAHDSEGTLRAIVANYACHCTTMGGGFNQHCGDWAGFAAEQLEKDHPGALALITIGCAGDQNPHPRGTIALSKRHGAALASAVNKVLADPMERIRGTATASLDWIELPFAEHPTRAEWEARARRKDAIGHHARVQLERLDAGQKLRQAMPYPIQVWRFGTDLSMVFLGGEVVIDYALSLSRTYDRERLWVSAYCNDVQGYIPSERILREGGYEGGGAMTYYDQPTKLASGVEKLITDTVRARMPDALVADPMTGGTMPRDVERARTSFRTAPGMRMELVASEPLVVDPVAIDFGADGRLWVVEMGDYPDGRPGVGRVKVLSDKDGDGRMDTAVTFLEGIPFPTGVMAWGDGALVCAAPDILLARDTDGDGKADVRTRLFTGFATHNYQARVNALRWGLDGWIWGANGLFGGKIRSRATAHVQDLSGRDFRIHPGLASLRPALGLTQQGRERSDFGDWFGCDNGTLAWHYPVRAAWLARAPGVKPPPTRVRLVAGEEGRRLFPVSRPRPRFNRPEDQGRVTSACGLSVYRDVLLGTDMRSDLLVCEPVHNLVRRIALEPRGATYEGHAVLDGDREWLSSTDPWFRPVQTRTGPDGAVWIVDMYRYVVEHPVWIPKERHKELDFAAGNDRGRIWRLVPEGDALPSWGAIGDPDRALRSSNGTVRDLAQRALRASVKGPGRSVLAHPDPAVRAQGLWTVALTVKDLLVALEDSHPGVRRQAVLLSAGHVAGNPDLIGAILDAAADPDPQVRLAAAAVIGRLDFPRAGVVLGQLMAQDARDPWISGVALISAATGTEKLVAALEVLVDGDAVSAETLRLVASLGRDRAPGTVRRLALRMATDPDVDLKLRVEAVSLLDRRDDVSTLFSLVTAKTPLSLQLAALRALARIGTKDVSTRLLGRLSVVTPQVRTAILDVLLSRPSWAGALLDRVAEDPDAFAHLDATRREFLLTHQDDGVRGRAATVLATKRTRARDAVLAEYASALTLDGDALRGRTHFTNACATCHRVGNVGRDLGPDLQALTDRSKSGLLAAILDPNRAVLAPYVGYSVRTRDGRSRLGLVSDESATAFVLRTVDGRAETVLRRDVLDVTGTGRSLMPVGIEFDLEPQDVADVIAFMLGSQTPPKQLAGNRPRPVSQQDDGSITCHASEAEIFGGDITFETPFGNVGYWHGARDHVAWTVRCKKPGMFGVVLDLACAPDCDGNRWVLDVAASSVSGVVPDTGGWNRYRDVRAGTVELPAGTHRLVLRPDGGLKTRSLMDLRTIRLVPVR